MSVRELAGIAVSRETIDRLTVLSTLLEKWNRRINLVGRDTVSDTWSRHIIDSAQVFRLASAGARTWIDLGSGAGFPGLVCAALSNDEGRGTRFTLVESDHRKAAFLREAARQMDLAVSIVADRIEEMQASKHDIVSARALASVSKLLEMSERLISPSGVLLLPKGRNVESELTEAERDWHIAYDLFPSAVEAESVILRISEFRARR